MVRQRFFALYFLLLGLGTLLLSACTTTTTQPQSHATYIVRFAGASPTTGHPGSSITATWKRDPGGVSNEATPEKLLFILYLIGPYQSVDAANHTIAAAQHTSESLVTLKEGPVVVRTTPIQTDDWSGKTLTTSVHLPRTPGYYILVQTAAYPGDNGEKGEDNADFESMIIHVI